MKQKLVILFVILLAVAIQSGFNLNSSAFKESKEKTEIWILSRGFLPNNPHYEPQNVTAKVGTSVIWINGDKVHHTVTNDAGTQNMLEGQIFDSGPIGPGSEFILDTTNMLDGAYPYHCTIHPWARGNLVLVTEPITVHTDKSLYSVGEEITVFGDVPIPAIPDTSKIPKLVNATLSVTLEILNQENKLLLSNSIPIFEGKYSYSFIINEPSIYTINVYVDSFTATTKFEVTTKGIIIETVKFESEGREINKAKVGQEISIIAEIRNKLEVTQNYIYIIQVKDMEQITVLLEWKSYSVPPQSLSTSIIKWIPEREGIFYIETFVWSSIEAPKPLSMQKNVTLSIE